MTKRSASEIREIFLSFFEQKGHFRAASSPLVPQNDPSLLFTNAGMNQFKDTFTGREKRDYSRACSSQKCVRAGGKHNDLDNVGYTARHHTFFEMLGNFSFGDYFKKEAIAYAWELITSPQWLGIDPSILAITIFEGDGGIPADEEAASFWREQGVREERIFRLGKKDNFWQMGDTGPCGPCSEIHIYRGPRAELADIDAHARKFFLENAIADSDSWMEIWNLVFMQFEMAKNGSLSPLPSPSIDTGAGLERLCAVVQEVESNYDTDLMLSIIGRIEKLIGKTYQSSVSVDDVAMRVIADHARATAFLVADGVLPSNEGRGYVLRRILRRAIRYGSRLGFEEPFFYEITDEVISQMGGFYSELITHRSTILEFAKMEEVNFRRTLDKGMRLLSEAMAKVEIEGKQEIPSETVFFLYDTHGFPADLTRIVAAERNLKVDEKAFEEYKAARVANSRFVNTAEQSIADVYHQIRNEIGNSEFLGYESISSSGTIRALIAHGKRVSTVSASEESVEVICDRTSFYGESGGQVGDTGVIQCDDLMIEVHDTIKPVGGMIVHRGIVKKGVCEVGCRVHLQVNAERRQSIRLNHSATHLLHHVLRSVLGDHVKQAGSKVSPDGFRFDYTHFSALSLEQIVVIEEKANSLIRQNISQQGKVVTMEEARQEGATMLFGEKYGEKVRMVRFGPSLELCGGVHADHTGDIGAFLIVSDESLAAGVRRMVGVTGAEAIRRMQEQRRSIRSISDQLRTTPEMAEKAIEKLVANLKRAEKELDRLKKQGSILEADDLAKRAREIRGIQVITARIDPADIDQFRIAADKLRDRLKTSLIVLGGEREGKAILLAAASKNAVAQGIKAGDLIRDVAKEVGGRGGGKADLGQAGGLEVSKIDRALERVYELLA